MAFFSICFELYSAAQEELPFIDVKKKAVSNIGQEQTDKDILLSDSVRVCYNYFVYI